MADIKRLLNKKGWTGRELGILELTNMAVMYRQALEGKEPEPLVEQAQFRKMINSITDSQQGRVYNGYISIHEWLAIRYNIAQTQLQQAQLQYRTLVNYVTSATLAEDAFKYVEQLPLIMTQKQYEETKAERIEARFKDEDGKELYSGVFDLVERAITFYSRQLQREPGKANPLKAIRKKYISQPVKSKLILSRWNETQGEGYYTIEDGSGRRSDQMTAEEWQDAITTPAMKQALRDMRATDGSGTELTQRIAAQRFIDRAKVIFDGGTEEEADREQERKDYERGLATPVKWHTAEEPPTDLTKWDIIEQELLYDFYPADLDGSGDAWSESNFTASMEDFVAEFKELVTAILKDIDKKYFKGEPGLSPLPVSEWLSTVFSWRQLYEKDFYGERAEAESDIQIFDGNRRAILNGIAILRPSDLAGKSTRIDERGYYVEPEIRSALQPFTLEGFFMEAEDYADNIEIAETSRRSLIESYYHVQGYNASLDMIARYYDVPELSIFKMDIETVEDQIDAFNSLVPILYRKIKDTDYEDKELQAKKLQVLKDFFQPIDYKALTIPEENREAAELLLEEFKAFQPENSDRFTTLLCTLPQTDEEDEDGEGAY